MLTITPLGVQAGNVPYNVGSQQYDVSKEIIWFDFLITLSGNYPTGGDTLDFTSINPLGYSLGNAAPTTVDLKELVQAGGTATGFQALYCPGPTINTNGGATPAGGTVQFLGGATASQDGLNQIAAGAYANTTPSLNGAVYKGLARFVRNIG